MCLNKAECIKEHHTLADAFTDTSADGVNVSAASSLMLASLLSLTHGHLLRLVGDEHLSAAWKKTKGDEQQISVKEQRRGLLHDLCGNRTTRHKAAHSSTCPNIEGTLITRALRA